MNARRAFSRVFRRRVKMAWVSCSNAVRSFATGSSADETAAGRASTGPSAPAGTRQAAATAAGSTSAAWPISIAQDAVLLRPRESQEPVGDLALQHHRRVGQRDTVAIQADQPEQDGRGDVVGKVPGDAEPCARRHQGDQAQTASVRFEGNRLRRPVRLGGPAFAAFRQDRDRSRRRRRLAPGRERVRERAAAGADLEEHIGGLRIDGAKNLLDPGPLEKMLPEAFSWGRSMALAPHRPCRADYLFDLTDLFLAQPKVVADFVNQRFANGRR